MGWRDFVLYIRIYLVVSFGLLLPMANMDRTTDLPDELLEVILSSLVGFSADLSSFVQSSGENKSAHSIEARVSDNLNV